VFADLGMPNSQQELRKAELTMQIFKLVSERKLTQSKAAELLGTTRLKCLP
jgi:predicted XRE-type DNA-binding protein